MRSFCVAIEYTKTEGNMPENAVVDVQSHVYQLQTIFSKKYDIDFYQREYVWQKSHLDDLINDLYQYSTKGRSIYYKNNSYNQSSKR